jgi:hypothetical protein
MTKSDQREPLLATIYRILQNNDFSPKAPAEAEHITVGWTTHDPFITWTRFKGFLAKSCLLSVS